MIDEKSGQQLHIHNLILYVILLLMLYLYCHKQVVLSPLVALSKTLQKENLTLADAAAQMSATRTVMEQLKEQ